VGGVEVHVEEISKRLVKEGFDVEILTVDTSGQLASKHVHNGVKVRRFKSYFPSSISEVYYPSWKLWRYLLKNSHKYDIVHAHNYHALPSLYAAQTKSSNKFVFTPHYHGAGSYFFRNLLHVPYKLLGRGIFEKSDRIICVSKYEKYLVLNKMGVNAERITVIPNGIDLNQLKNTKRKTKGFKSILYVGRIEKYKGIQFVLKALPKIRGNVILEIVGVGAFKTELLKLVKTLGIERRVRFYQNLERKQLLQKFADADVFVMLSTRESYGMTVAEALSLGTPCVVSNYSALREWIDAKTCFGISYPPDVNELAKLIHRVLNRTVDYASIRKRVPSWDYVAEKLIEIYEDLKN
jgi:glycosyltransferase involved in cell wall biosynthesis